MTNEEIDRRIQLYSAALYAMWKAKPSMETMKRHNSFIDCRRGSRVLWVEWVEKNVDNIPWCAELVATKVTLELTR